MMFEPAVKGLIGEVKAKLLSNAKTAPLVMSKAADAYYVPDMSFDPSVRKILVQLREERKIAANHLWLLITFTRNMLSPADGINRRFEFADIDKETFDANLYWFKWLQSQITFTIFTNSVDGAASIEELFTTTDMKMTFPITQTIIPSVPLMALVRDFNVDNFEKLSTEQYGNVSSVSFSATLVFPSVVLKGTAPAIDPSKVIINTGFTIRTDDYFFEKILNTDIDITTGIITVARNILTGTPIEFALNKSTDLLPEALSELETYFVIRVSDTKIKLAPTLSAALKNNSIEIATLGTLATGSYYILRLKL